VTAVSLTDHLGQFTDADDRLFVVPTDNANWAGLNLLIDLNKV
jgi:hypothetical protein